MENKIKHVGIVESVVGDCVKVRIVQSSACSLCKAAKQCHASESKEKVVDVYRVDGDYTVGQKVMVLASYGVGLFAVSLAMLVPLLLVTAVLCVMTALSFSEITSALTSLSILIPYYIILFIFRKQVDRKVSFDIVGL